MHIIDFADCLLFASLVLLFVSIFIGITWLIIASILGTIFSTLCILYDKKNPK